MIKIENTDVYGFEAAIRGMRNPRNSWDKSDSKWDMINNESNEDDFYFTIRIGDADKKLMKQLVAAGSDHSKFMRMLTVTCDITAPLYWWKEFDTYKVGTVRNSCSTMHTIHKKPFEIDDFSHEHMISDSMYVLEEVIKALNICRHAYINYDECKRDLVDEVKEKKDIWWQIIQLLPSSYNQRATWQANYAVLRNIYNARKNHKLDEWREFCAWVESLPHSGLITYSKEDENNG